MSQSDYYEEVIPSQKPCVIGTTTTTTKSNHRHHHHDDDHHHHHHGSSSSSIGWATWLCIFVFSAFFLTIFIIAVVTNVQSNNVEHHVHSQFMQWQTTMDEQQEQQDTLATNMVTMSLLSSKGRVQRRVMLCARQSYYNKKGEDVDGDENKLHVLSQSIEEIREREMKDFYYYHVSAHLRLSLSQEKSHLAIDYNITSSFGRISTIRLEELEFNTADQSLGAMRSIILCSNNPFMDVQRCDASLTKRNILALHGQETIPLVIALPESKYKTTLPPVVVTSLHEEQVIDLTAGEEEEEEEKKETSHKHKQRREVLDQRMYNIVFYQTEVSSSDSSSSQKNRTHVHGSGSLYNTNSYKEHRILTLEPTQC